MVIQNLYRQFFKIYNNPVTRNIGRRETDLEIYIKQHAFCERFEHEYISPSLDDIGKAKYEDEVNLLKLKIKRKL